MKKRFMKNIFLILLCSCVFCSVQNVSFALETYSQAASSSSISNSNDNYLEEVYQKYKQIVYWQKNYLLVYIPHDAREQFVWSQFKVWENVLGGLITFEKVNTDKNADITVNYENQYIAKKVGFTRLSFKDGAIRHADMFIYDDILTNPLKNFAVLHEVGHSLGITNHSSNPSDIMYATKTARQNGLSARDKNTIKMIYGAEGGSNNLFNSASDLSLRNSDLQKADMLFQGNQYEAAAQEYKKAAANSKDEAEAYSGMAACYYALGQGETAYKYAKKAIALKSSNRELVYTYMRIGISTGHSKEVKKFLDKYIIEYPDSLADNEIQSTLILIQNNTNNNKK